MKSPMKTTCLIFVLTSTLLLSSCTPATSPPTPANESENMENMSEMEEMQGMSGETGQYAPLVDAFYNDGEIQFIHTEASDPDVANMLTEMMNGPLVVLVPELVEAPDRLLANVYVFTNGLQGMGPFGYQLDIFDSVPGEAAYRPLRRVNLVAWNEGAPPRELRSFAALQEAETAGEVTITQPGIVANMPVLVWPGGHR